MPSTQSHKTSVKDGIVTIHDFDVFMGFNHDIDDPDGRFAKYDAAKVDQIVAETNKRIDLGSRPKLIVEHNPNDKDAPGRPVVGDFVSVRAGEKNGIPHIFTDVEMREDNFKSLLKSGNYPRRSVEVWANGNMAQVALLGSRTPARPLVDAKFHEDGEEYELLTREYSGETFGDPGSGNATVPKGTKKKKPIRKKGSEMTDEQKKEAEKMQAELDTANEKLEKFGEQIKAKDTEIKTLKSKGSESLEKMQEIVTKQSDRIDELVDANTHSTVSAAFDKFANEGYVFTSAEVRKEAVDRCVAAEDTEAELAYTKSLMTRAPVDVHINHSELSIGSDATDKLALDGKAAEKASARCTAENKPEMFTTYLNEERDKLSA